MCPRRRNLFGKYASVIAVWGAGAFLLSCNPPNHSTKPIELSIYAKGPWAVTVSIGNCCDSAGDKFDLYDPSTPAPPTGGFLILTGGNGTNSASSNYSYFLKHTAS